MKLKLLTLALMFSSAAFAAKPPAVVEPNKAGSAVVAPAEVNKAAKGDKEAKEKLQKGKAAAGTVQERAGEVETQAEKDNAPNAENIAWAKNAVPKIREKLKDCTSGLCEALKGEVAELAEKGDRGAVEVLSAAGKSVKGIQGSEGKTNAITAAVKEAGRDPKAIEEACPGK